MTNKRFENRLNKDNVKFNTLNPVWDNLKEDALNVFEMIDMLNHLYEENNELRLMLNSCSDQRDEFHRGARENANRVGKLKKENEQLKAQLYCDDEEGVCNICKHHYLEKGETYEKYYISKCKKGHEECSKIDLKYCDDFELKER